jgi:monoamine oxidase
LRVWALFAQNDDGTFALGFRDKSSQFTVVADRVILALPFSVLRRLDYGDAGFPAIKRVAIEQLGYGSNAKLHLQFSQRLWNTSGPWGLSTGASFADTGYQSTWDVTRAQPGSGTPGYFFWLVGVGSARLSGGGVGAGVSLMKAVIAFFTRSSRSGVFK